MARLILLTAPDFAATVAAPLRAAAPDAEIRFARTLAELEAALAGAGADVRVIAIGTGVIVPARVLTTLAGPAYNVHPGPPEYPGIFPSVFALYAGAKHFGVTLHEMAEQIDSGPIVAVESFAIPPDWDRLALDTAAFAALLRLIEQHARQLADPTARLARIERSWSGPRRTRKDFEALCRLPEDVTTEEFVRRYRAVGEGPEHSLTITRFDHTFRLESTKRGDVVRAGQPITNS